ncbi:phosphomannomutase/phosphoglucomutase [Candidatus Roizmanbacteria bacterium]|nr:phosphomannomutase/phosphoglucomutase [Candidatus Roizmanbacteria bacterium]
MNPSIFKAYDIRGLYPSEINSETIQTIVKAIYSFFVTDIQRENLQVVLGRDMRLSSPELFEKAKDALVSLGAQVIDIGLVPTTAVYYAVLKGNYDVGIQISASHNPPQYNGVKLVKRDGTKLIKIGKTTGMDEVKRRAVEGDFVPSAENGAVAQYPNAIADEVENALATVRPTHIRPLKVVADPANAMGATYIAELFKKVPGELIPINFNLDGNFPAHKPNPLEFETLVQLQQKVREEKADLGIATDGDGDRVFFIDEKGQILSATITSALIAKEILTKKPGEKILVDVRYTRNVQAVVEKYQGTTILSQVGHALITKLLNDEGAAFAGESSGHYYFRETGGGESAVRVIVTLLELIGAEQKPLSELVRDVQSSIESGEINFVVNEGTTAADIIQSVLSSYPDGEVSRQDGVSIDYPDWRVNIRSSNTEPLLRLNVEGQSQEIVDTKVEELKSQIIAAGSQPESHD